MKTTPTTPSKQLAASHQRLVACIAICLLFAGFVVVCIAGRASLGTLALYTALVSGVARVAIEFFKCIRG